MVPVPLFRWSHHTPRGRTPQRNVGTEKSHTGYQSHRKRVRDRAAQDGAHQGLDVANHCQPDGVQAHRRRIKDLPAAQRYKISCRRSWRVSDSTTASRSSKCPKTTPPDHLRGVSPARPKRRASTMPPTGGARLKASIPGKRTCCTRPSLPMSYAGFWATRLVLATRSDVDLTAQVTAKGATWRDHRLLERDPMPLAVAASSSSSPASAWPKGSSKVCARRREYRFWRTRVWRCANSRAARCARADQCDPCRNGYATRGGSN